jgi:DNA-binding LacI/PurR family transcriptional regulator
MNGRGGAWKLARQLAEMIEKGKYAPGSRLPSYRELGEKFGLTSGVVSYGMSILAKQGYVERRHGSGVFVRTVNGSPAGPRRQADLYALVVPDIESGLYLSIQAGMESSVQASRAQLITMTTGGNATRQADALMQLIDRDVAGIALVPSYDGQEGYQLRQLRRANIPLVLLHRGVPDVSVPVIDIPFAEVGYMAGKAIAEQGHQRVGAFFGLRSPLTEQYLDGYRRGLALKNANLSEEWASWSDSMIIAPSDHAQQREAIEHVIDRVRRAKNRPTAFFVSFDRLAVMVYFAALKQGLRVPEDLSIVSFGAGLMSEVTPLRMAAVTVDEYRTGQQAQELLVEMHAGRRAMDEDVRCTMEVSFEAGETLTAPSRLKATPSRRAASKRRSRR